MDVFSSTQNEKQACWREISGAEDFAPVSAQKTSIHKAQLFNISYTKQGGSMNTETPAKKSTMDKIIDGISGIFLPIVNLLSAAGILKGILVILTSLSVLSDTGDTYLVLNAMADSLFYFLPIFLAFTAGRKFGANPYVAVIVAGVMLYPSLNSVLEAGDTVYFLGLPLRGVTYHSSVIPIILAAALLRYVEKLLVRIVPKLIQSFTVPLLSVLIVSFVTLLVFGPIGAIIGDGLATGYEWIYGLSPVIAGFVLCAIIQPMVIFGFHWSFFLVSMNNIALTGSDTILTLMAPSVFAQAGAAIAVMIKSKNKAFKSACASAALSAVLGVTEPAMFGVNLPRKKPMIAVCIGAGIGGGLAGLSGASAVSFVLPSLASLPVFFGDGFALMMVGCAVAAVSAFVITMLIHHEEA